MTTIQIVEVGPRDGLQNEKKILSVEDRVHLIDLLSECGFREIEVGSFVSPKWVPQMAHTADVYQKIHKKPGVMYSALVPNTQGLDEAIKAHVTHISVFTAASEAFNQKNINCSIAESFERFTPLFEKAKSHHIRIRGYVSCVVACPFSGDVAPALVKEVSKRLWSLGCDEISLGDTIGKGTPDRIEVMIKTVTEAVPASALAIHCHDTYGQALDNIQTALELGVRVVDSALNGLGGCPYGGEKAKGNVSTQSVLQHLDMLGYQTTIHNGSLQKAASWLKSKMVL